MMTREPKCIQWKRQGAEAVAVKILNLNPEEELIFWQEQTRQLKIMQENMRKMKSVTGSDKKRVTSQ